MKVDIIEKSTQIFSNPGIKCPDKLNYLMYANTYVLGYIKQILIDVAIGNMEAIKAECA